MCMPALPYVSKCVICGADGLLIQTSTQFKDGYAVGGILTPLCSAHTTTLLPRSAYAQSPASA